MIDAHTHIQGGQADLNQLLDELDLKVLNICVPADADRWRKDSKIYRPLAEKFPARYAWCTAFDPPDFADPDYAEKSIARLEEDFRLGALACKIWKNVGMQVKDPAGNFIQMDHPIFDPIYDCLTKASKPLLMHIAEPISCWGPVDKNSPTDSYYLEHPEWHMYGKADVPSHAEIIAARDRVIAARPEMIFVAAHMGSQESNLSKLAACLDKYPNLAIDTTRSYNMGIADHDEVRRFFTKYQDRIMFASDASVLSDLDEMDESERRDMLHSLRKTWEAERLFHTTDQQVEIEGQSVRGIALSDEVTEKIFCTNAKKWYPGI